MGKNTGKNTKKPNQAGKSAVNVKNSNFTRQIIIIAAALVILIAGVTVYTLNNKTANNKKVVDVSIMTDKGEIVAELRPDLMPVTVDNFMKLVNSGFYNGLKFHRVEDWVIQAGDPKGDGTGGPGWTIKLETNPRLKNVKYAIAMARSQDPNSAGSQFYILKKDASWLDGQYAVFGNVIKGQDVVDKIEIGDKMKEVKEVK